MPTLHIHKLQRLCGRYWLHQYTPNQECRVALISDCRRRVEIYCKDDFIIVKDVESDELKSFYALDAELAFNTATLVARGICGLNHIHVDEIENIATEATQQNKLLIAVEKTYGEKPNSGVEVIGYDPVLKPIEVDLTRIISFSAECECGNSHTYTITLNARDIEEK